jgi:delta 1-pyrroline-5-carboxylate dehydrogenase
MVAPTVVADVDPSSPFAQNELFGPAVAVSTATDWESAIAQANGTAYGLAAGIFTSDVAGAVRAIREIDAGSVHINWSPLWRADLMPYGGPQGKRDRQGGSSIGRRGNDRGQNRHPARPAVVADATQQSLVAPAETNVHVYCSHDAHVAACAS